MRAILGVALVVLASVVVGCGGSKSSRSTSSTEAPASPTKAQYAAMLKHANAQVTKVEGAAERRLTSKATRAQVKALIDAWGDTEKQLGKSFRAVRPPSDAVDANALLARGEITFGTELKRAAAHLPAKTAAVGTYLQRRLGHARGAALIDQAIAKLKAAGYG
jgi:hypothetical protein